MQPKQNIWNIILFTVLSFLVLIGWSQLQHWLWPPPPPPERPVALNLDWRPWTDLLALSSGSALTTAVPGAGNLSQLATDMAVARWLAGERPKLELARRAEPKPQLPKMEALPAGKHEVITLGGESFNLEVVVTSKGAGVRSVVLTRFKAA